MLNFGETIIFEVGCKFYENLWENISKAVTLFLRLVARMCAQSTCENNNQGLFSMTLLQIHWKKNKYIFVALSGTMITVGSHRASTSGSLEELRVGSKDPVAPLA